MHSAPTSISAAIGRDHEFSEIKITNLPWSANKKIFFVVHHLLILKVLHMIIEICYSLHLKTGWSSFNFIQFASINLPTIHDKEHMTTNFSVQEMCRSWHISTCQLHFNILWPVNLNKLIVFANYLYLLKYLRFLVFIRGQFLKSPQSPWQQQAMFRSKGLCFWHLQKSIDRYVDL